MTDLGTSYPATAEAPSPSSLGMVVHSLLDISMYAGTPVYDRYIAAETEEEQDVILRDMPNATVTFSEAAEGDDPFALPPAEFLDHLADLEAQEKQNSFAPEDATDPG